MWQNRAHVITCDTLAPDQLKPGSFSDFLAAVPGDSIAAVGHMPEIGRVRRMALSATEESIAMAKAAACCIDFKKNRRRPPENCTGSSHQIGL